MKNKEIKKIQRAINKETKRINKNIYDDELWKGRFIIKQTNRKIYRYEDGSGYHGIFEMLLLDKQTGIYAIQWFDDYSFICSWRTWEWINDFIVYSVDVWKEQPRRETTINWRDRQGSAPQIEHNVHHDALKYFR